MISTQPRHFERRETKAGRRVSIVLSLKIEAELKTAKADTGGVTKGPIPRTHPLPVPARERETFKGSKGVQGKKEKSPLFLYSSADG